MRRTWRVCASSCPREASNPRTKGGARSIVSKAIPTASPMIFSPIEEADGRISVRLKIADARSLLPWLRTFWPLAHVSLPQSPHLAERLKEDLEEALENYVEHPSLS